MIPRLLSKSDLEATYDRLAEAIDAVPQDKRMLFLAKLAFTLADLVGDPARIEQAVTTASRDL